jgi:hypothetical protein
VKDIMAIEENSKMALQGRATNFEVDLSLRRVLPRTEVYRNETSVKSSVKWNANVVASRRVTLNVRQFQEHTSHSEYHLYNNSSTSFENSSVEGTLSASQQF